MVPDTNLFFLGEKSDQNQKKKKIFPIKIKISA